jgi:hypothetical protein
MDGQACKLRRRRRLYIVRLKVGRTSLADGCMHVTHPSSCGARTALLVDTAFVMVNDDQDAGKIDDERNLPCRLMLKPERSRRYEKAIMLERGGQDDE